MNGFCCSNRDTGKLHLLLTEKGDSASSHLALYHLNVLDVSAGPGVQYEDYSNSPFALEISGGPDSRATTGDIF